MKKQIIVKEYNPQWKLEFSKLKSGLEEVLDNTYLDILHIGSTSVEGLAAKPIIDIVIVINLKKFQVVKSKLSMLRYYHNGDQGISGREVFKLELEEREKYFKHHLYVCDENSDELLRYKIFLAYLRKNPDARASYGTKKMEAAALHPNDIEAYMDYKGELVASILTKALNMENYANRFGSKTCINCSSEDIQKKIDIIYTGNGMKDEYIEISCNKCEKKLKEKM